VNLDQNSLPLLSIEVAHGIIIAAPSGVPQIKLFVSEKLKRKSHSVKKKLYK